MRRARPGFAASDIPTVDDWAELSAVGWGTSWAVVGSSLVTMVEGCGADADWMRQSDEAAVRRRLRDERAVRQAFHAEQVAAKREVERREQVAVSAHIRELRELRYELEALRARQTLREYRRTHPFGVEFYGPMAGGREPEWHPINMGLKSEAEAVAMAEHFTRVQGIHARAVAW